MDPNTLTFLVLFGSIALVLTCCCFLCILCDDTDDQRTDHQLMETQRLARRLAEWEELAARAEAALAAQAAAAAAVTPPVLMPLPYFPYAAAENKPAECSICLEPLRQLQLCSEVPACRHVFHRECLGAWARSSGSCPLCRAKIVPGSYEVAVTDDMV
ncbi:unnamed protein product [Urochloa humidicola]